MAESEFRLWARNLAIRSKSDVTLNQSAYEMRVLRKAVSEHGSTGLFPNILDTLENSLALDNEDVRNQYQTYQSLLDTRDIFDASFKAAKQSLVLAQGRKDRHCFVETEQDGKKDKKTEWSFRKRNLGKQNDVYNCMNYFLEIAADVVENIECQRQMTNEFQHRILKGEREMESQQRCNIKLRRDIGEATRRLFQEKPMLREEIYQIAIFLTDNNYQFADIESEEYTDDEKVLLLDKIVNTHDEDVQNSFEHFINAIVEQSTALRKRKRKIQKEACGLNCEMMKGKIQVSQRHNKIRNTKEQLSSQRKDRKNVAKALKHQNSLHQTFSEENEFLEYRMQFVEETTYEMEEELSSVDSEIKRLKEKCNYYRYARDLYKMEYIRLSENC